MDYDQAPRLHANAFEILLSKAYSDPEDYLQGSVCFSRLIFFQCERRFLLMTHCLGLAQLPYHHGRCDTPSFRYSLDTCSSLMDYKFAILSERLLIGLSTWSQSLYFPYTISGFGGWGSASTVCPSLWLARDCRLSSERSVLGRKALTRSFAGPRNFLRIYFKPKWCAWSSKYASDLVSLYKTFGQG